MASIGTLWTTPGQASGKIIRAAVALSGLSVDIPADYVHYEDNKKPEFLSKFIHGKVPALETKDGFKLFEGAAIARYVAGLAPNAGLLGKDANEAALVDQWVHLVDSEVWTYTSLYNGLVGGKFAPYSKPLQTFFTDRQLNGLKTLEAHLSTHTFFVGERITLADLAVAAYIQRAGGINFDSALRAQLPNLVRHLTTIVNQPSLTAVYGPLELIDKALQYTPPAKDKKEAAPKPAAAPKAEKKPKAKAVEEDEEEELVPAEVKVKNPLDDLPKSTLNLEDWKRAYSNKETRGAGGAIEWLYENFDKEGYSVYRIDFKYNSELTQTFMSSNQITGFFTRLEASRKYLFASVGVLGTTNDSVISGVLILRGQDAVPVVNAAPDWESYEYKKLDIANEDDKKFIEAALAWDLEIDGKKWVDGKNFK